MKTVIYKTTGVRPIAIITMLLLLGNISSFGQMTYADSAAMRVEYLKQKIEAAKTLPPGNFSLDNLNLFQTESGLQPGEATKAGNETQAATTSLPTKYDIYVATNGNDNNSGTQAAPLRTIQRAIDKAISGKTIKVADGWYYENINFLGKSIKLVGNPDDPTKAVITANCYGIVVTMTTGEDNNTLLCGFTIKDGGNSTGKGAAIYLDNGASPLLSHLMIVRNSAVSGCALAAFNQSKPVMQNTMIYANDPGTYFIHIESAEAVLRNIVLDYNANATADVGVIGGSKVSVFNSIINNTNSNYAVYTNGTYSSASINYCNIRGGNSRLNGSSITTDNMKDFNPGFVPSSFLLATGSPCIDAGHPDDKWNDVDFPPSKGTVRNDMGAYGGPGLVNSHTGDTHDNPIDVPTNGTSFQFTDSKNTNDFSNAISTHITSDIFYRFTLTRQMDVEIKLCGSSIDTYLLLLNENGSGMTLDAEGKTVEYYNDNYTGPGQCSNTTHSYMKRRLSPGTYYAVVEGKSGDGNITTSISGVFLPEAIPGDTRQNPIVWGTFNNSFELTSSHNTTLFSNTYTGRPTNDVFYRFSIPKKMDITLSQCGSNLADTYLYLLDTDGNKVAENDNYTGTGQCSSTLHAYISMKGLATGTYYVVSEGTSQNGNINTRIKGTEIKYDDDFQYPNQPPSTDNSTTDNSSVGMTAGAIHVGATGAATYNIPIWTPQGLTGMTPSIAVTYSSQAGNGVAGWGCNISGVSAITRRPKTIYHDGAAAPVTYGSNYDLMLDGKVLIRSGSDYIPEDDPFTIVTAKSEGTGTYFEVKTRDGAVYQYGKTDASRQVVGTTVYGWYLDRATSIQGNYALYSYSYIKPYNYLYLEKITYGYNKHNTWLVANSIVFSYEDRPDVTLFRLGTTEGKMSCRLRSIGVYSGTVKGGTEAFRGYDFGYSNTDQFSRLTSMTERNGNGEALKPLTLQWSNYGASNNHTSGSLVLEGSLTDMDKQYFSSADLNGDGVSDIVSLTSGYEAPDEGKTVYTLSQHFLSTRQSNGSYKFVATKGKYLASNLKIKEIKHNQSMGGHSAFNALGDGKQYLLAPLHLDDGGGNRTIFYVYNHENNNTHNRVPKPTGTNASVEMTASSELPAFTTGDIDNDGKDEIVYIEKGASGGSHPGKIGKVAAMSTTQEVSFDNWTSLSLNLSDKPHHMIIADFNGDGMNDLIVFQPMGYRLYWNNSTGTRFSDTNVTVVNNFFRTASYADDPHKLQVGDFNGDGFLDFVMNEASSRDWHIALNNGDGKFTKSFAITLDIFNQDFTGKDKDKFNCHVFDFDYDGKTDVVITKAMYRKEDDPLSSSWGVFIKTYSYWLRSTGSSLTQVAAVTSDNEHDAPSGFYVTGDFNGDGRAELANYGYNCFNSNTAREWRIYQREGLQLQNGMLTSITDGMGHQTSIEYGNFTDPGLYTKGTGATYPVMDIRPALTAVKKVTTPDGIGGTGQTSYTYAGLKIHVRGKGMMGMSKTTVSNNITGVSVESGVSAWDNTFKFAPTATYSNTTVAGKTASSTTGFIYVSKGTGYFTYPETQTDKDFDGNTTTTTRVYDNNGNITEENVSSGTNMFRKTKYTDYVSMGATLQYYQPQTVTITQKHSDDASQEFTTKTKYEYYTDCGLLFRTTHNTHAPANQQVVTADVYDDTRNVILKKVIVANQATVTRHFVPDPTYRFVSKEYSDPASSVTSYTYDILGNPLTETDETNPANLRTTTHTYDAWGRHTTSTSPDGLRQTFATGWGGSRERKYYTLAQGNGMPWVKTWYDATGRETKTQSIGAKGLNMETEKFYNSKGQVRKTTSTQGDISAWTSYLYDTQGRLNEETHSSGQKITHTYGNRSSKQTINSENWQEKTFDAWGNILTSSDPKNVVKYTYYSNGLPKNISGAGALYEMEYDSICNQKKLIDPNAGTIQYRYDALGRVVWQKDGNGQLQTTKYDALGRVENSKTGDILTSYEYVPSGNGIYQVKKITTGTHSISYTYDAIGRTVNEQRVVDGAAPLSFTYAYNAMGQLETVTYPESVKVVRQYDTYGNMVKILAAGQAVWELTGVTGTVTTAKLGADMVTTTTRNAQGLVTNLKTVKGSATVLRNFSYSFNGTTGNLNWRTGMIAKKESFYYDSLYRLTTIKHGTPEVQAMSVGFDNNGNIRDKTGLGTYSYHSTKKHAVEMIDNTGKLLNTRRQLITYNAFNKATNLVDTVNNTNGTTTRVELDIKYGPDQQRWKSDLKKNGSIVKTITFAGDYEKMVDKGLIWQLYYIYGGEGLAAIYVKRQFQEDRIYYAHTDHQGSIVKLTDAAGATAYSGTYDAWGKMTPSNYDPFPFYRGYTGHEHLNEFGLINMNGRMYDPTVGRFLSPDPYVQAPDYSQSFNRYSYCLNNPLKYTDPSGEFITWNFSRRGFSIGINFSPISIPLGAGINIGWSDGGSIGAYGEIGYRVGGTGFGSGATVSQSFDYGFQSKSWSRTTTLGAYASFGMFNVGGNLTNTYDMKSGQETWGWDVSGGINLHGGEEWGLGLNAGYGSGGFNFGLGGFYNPPKIEREVVSDPNLKRRHQKKDNDCVPNTTANAYESITGGKMSTEESRNLIEPGSISNTPMKLGFVENFANKLGLNFSMGPNVSIEAAFAALGNNAKPMLAELGASGQPSHNNNIKKITKVSTTRAGSLYTNTTYKVKVWTGYGYKTYRYSPYSRLPIMLLWR